MFVMQDLQAPTVKPTKTTAGGISVLMVVPVLMELTHSHASVHLTGQV